MLVIVTQAKAACPGGINASFSASQTFFCGSGINSINFTNNTSGSIGSNASFLWYQNGVLFNTTSNTAASVSANASTIGTHVFMLVYSDPDVPCTDTAYVSVTVVPQPAADFTFTPNGGCAFQPVQFTSTSTGTNAGTTYTWDFGPGPNSSQQNPSHTFNTNGTYNVQLSISNGAGCNSSIILPVDVIDAPNAIISADDGDGDAVYCLFPGDNTSSETVVFSNSTTGAVSYEWDFGDGSPVVVTGSSAPLSHTYTTYGTYTVTMTAIGPNGCETVTTTTVVFEKFVSASLMLDLTEYSGCVPHDLSTLTNLSVNATNFVWNFGDGTSITSTNPTPPAYSYTTAGTYTISLTASNSCNTATATISPIIIIAGPTANFNASTYNGCAPQTISFSNASTGTQPANNYQWDMGNGNTYTNVTTPPAQLYSNTGTYQVTLIAGNACGFDTIVKLIVIDTIPTVDLIIDPIAGCAPVNVNPTATLLSGNNVNWQWYVDGVYYSSTPFDIPNQNFNSLNANDSTAHSIQVNVWNACGSDSEIETMYVNPPVVAAFTTQDTLCIGQSSVFSNASTGTNLSYSWDFGDGSPVDNTLNPIHTFSSAGNYTVTLTVNGYCGTSIASFFVTILPYPIVDFTPTPSQICSGETISITNNSTTEGTFSWNFGTGSTPATSNLYNPGTISYTGSGTSTINLTINHAGCISSGSAPIDIAPIPVPSFTALPSNGCSPLAVVLTNNTVDSPGTSYEWDYGNGNTSNAYLPLNQSYTTTGISQTYSIWLYVESSAGCRDSLMQTVSVHPLPTADFTILDDTLCLGESMLFANNSILGNTFSWDFGDGVTSTMTSPGHTYTSIGAFTTSLVATTAFGCTDTMSVAVYIDSIPNADFDFSIECFGSTTQFTNTSSGSPISYTWNFGDGSPTDNSTNPSHLYSAAGSYMVSLTATNGVNCTNTSFQLVPVNLMPVPNFSWSPTCEGQQMQFTDLSTNSPIAWSWDFGDGTNSLLQHPSHTYLDTGSYTVQLVVSGGSGCMDSIAMQVYVDSIPTAAFSFIQACTNEETYFTDNSSINPDSYLWNFGDGTNSSVINPVHTYTNAGNFPVSLTVSYTSNGCSNTIIQNVEAYPRTTPSFLANTPCLGDSTHFIDQTGNIPISWEWDFGDGSPLSYVQNPVHLYPAMGIYPVSLITSNSYGCIDTLNQSIEIYGLPVADFTFTTVCQGASSTFNDNSIDDVNWEWDFGDGSASVSNENPQHSYASSGSFVVSLVVFNQYTCSDTIQYLVTVNPNPIAGFYSDTACYSYETSLIDTSVDAISWEYSLGDLTTSTQSNPIHTYPAAGTYQVEQVVTNSFGCMDSVEHTILVLPQPSAGFINNTVCALDVVQFSDTSLGAITYWEWDFGDGSPADFTANPSHIFSVGGSYNVTLIAGNTSGCLDTTIVAVDVHTNPTAFFEADTVCYLEITHFTDLSSDVVPIASWYYDFGDNINQSNLQNPTYIYQAPGTYPASLTVTNIHGCDSTISINVIVNNIPVAAFTYDTVCWGSPTTFSDQSTGSVNSWNWDFGDGTSSSIGPVVQHTYAFPGSYLVSMEVDGGIGCTDIQYHAVSVINVITPQIGAPDSVCLNNVVQFQDLSVTNGVTITAWTWDFGDGSGSNLQNPSHSYATPGTYTVSCAVQTTSGCTNQATFTIHVSDLPQANFDFTIPCEGQPTIFTDLSSDPAGSITAWSWNFGDGSPLDNTQNPNHQYAVAGTYPVTLTITSQFGCTAVIQQDALIYPSPTASFINGLVCGGVPVDLVSTSTGTLVGYEWLYNSTTIGNTQNLTYTFPTDTDTHPVSLVVTSDLGCIDTVTQNVVTRPVVIFDFGPDQTAGCPVMEVSFFENSQTTSNGTIINWLWDMGDGSYAFGPNPVHYYEDAGTYYVSLQVITDEDCIYSDTLMYGVIVYPQPTAGFYYTPPVINILNPLVEFHDTSIGATEVEWYFGDFDYSNEWNPVHTYGDTGYYEVIQTVYNAYGCSDTAYHSLHVDGNLVVYVPNAFTPDGDHLNPYFNISGYGYTRYELLIFNRWGELLKTVTDPADGWDGSYKGVACQDGVYTWKLNVTDFNEIPHEFNGHVTLIR